MKKNPRNSYGSLVRISVFTQSERQEMAQLVHQPDGKLRPSLRVGRSLSRVVLNVTSALGRLRPLWDPPCPASASGRELPFRRLLISGRYMSHNGHSRGALRPAAVGGGRTLERPILSLCGHWLRWQGSGKESGKRTASCAATETPSGCLPTSIANACRGEVTTSFSDAILASASADGRQPDSEQRF